MITTPKLLGLCGSLRARSSNRSLLLAYERLCVPDAEFTVYDGVAALPHFNPDEDGDSVATEVARLRRLVGQSDAIVISTPEYAHALPGSFKNVLDWLVSDPCFAGKPTVIITAFRGTTWATDSLREVLRTMSAEVLEAESVALVLGSNLLDADQILARPELAGLLKQSVSGLLARCHPNQTSQ